MDKEISFHGNRCCLFECQSATQAELLMDMELIIDYGNQFHNPDGSLKHYLHTWDDGYRLLVRCKRYGALFIKQNSEYHGFSNEDSYYTDWYQVESKEVAELINAVYSGFSLERNYNGPWLKKTNDTMHWSLE